MQKLVYKYFTPNGIKEGKNLTSSSRLLVRVAEKLGIEYKIIPGTQIISLTYKGKEKYIYHQVPSTTTALAMYACNDKKITTNLLKQAEISVANGYSIKKNDDKEYLLEVFKSLKKPLVVKPIDGTWGENVTVDITTYEKYINAVKSAFSYSTKVNNSIVVEEMFSKGEEYRILATKEKIIGILKKIPANVVGNGIDTIEKLIFDKNEGDVRIKGGEKESHLKIKTDEKIIKYLVNADQKLDLNTVPQKNQKVFLKNFASISQGGDAIDFTDLAHPSVHEIALKAVHAIPGLSFAGIDFMSSDITKKQTKETYIIIEINTSPGFDIHDFPYEGKNRHAAREFLKLMFPEL